MYIHAVSELQNEFQLGLGLVLLLRSGLGLSLDTRNSFWSYDTRNPNRSVLYNLLMFRVDLLFLLLRVTLLISFAAATAAFISCSTCLFFCSY